MHWRNSEFQYVHFIFGACHTPLEAHRKCREAIEDREMALHEARNADFSTDDVPARMTRAHIEQAGAEVEFLNRCRLCLEAAIGFVPTPRDYQENQREEWRKELEFRAENFLLTSGTIPSDHFATMRLHPDFPQLLERINQVRLALQEGKMPLLEPATWKIDIQSEMQRRLPARE